MIELLHHDFTATSKYEKCRKCKTFKNLQHFTINKLTKAPFDVCDKCLRSKKCKTRIGKVCSKCWKIKGFDHFWQDKTASDQIGYWCKPCISLVRIRNKAKAKLKSKIV